MIELDEEQRRIREWRVSRQGIRGIIGPPGAGKTLLGDAIAIEKLRLGDRRILLTAQTNSAGDEFGRALPLLLGEQEARRIAVRTGFRPAVDPHLPIPFTHDARTIRSAQIVISTNLSLKHLRDISFDQVITDEAGIQRLEHLLWAMRFAVNPMALYGEQSFEPIIDLFDLFAALGAEVTVIGDPKQSYPISPRIAERSGIQWVINRAPHDTLHLTHRLPEPLDQLVNEFAEYGGLRSTPDAKDRRLILHNYPEHEFRRILDPESVVTMIDLLDGAEEQRGLTSYVNPTVARATARLCQQIAGCIGDQTIMVVTRYAAQRDLLSGLLNRLGLYRIKVVTTTQALGTQADLTIATLVRNNEYYYIAQEGSLQDLNVAISRARRKLIVLGSLEMMYEGLRSLPTPQRGPIRSPSRRLAWLLDQKYADVVEAPTLLI